MEKEVIAVWYQNGSEIFIGQPEGADKKGAHSITLVEPLIIRKNQIFLDRMSQGENKRYDDAVADFSARLMDNYMHLVVESPFYKERSKCERTPEPLTLTGLEGRVVVSLGKITEKKVKE